MGLAGPLTPEGLMCHAMAAAAARRDEVTRTCTSSIEVMTYLIKT